MPAPKTLRDFIEEHDLKAHVEWASDNPNMVSDQPMNHSRVTISTPADQFEVPFSQGLGITEDPTLEDVLDCLASDASLATEYGDGVEMAVSLGETIESMEDVKRARRAFATIEEQTASLRRLIGDDGMEELLYNVERL